MESPAPRSSPLGLTVLALLHYQPLHPYGIQRLVKDWGKEQVVNVKQRASLYRTIERLDAGGLIAVRETARAWLETMLAAPKEEFPAALSNLLLLTSDEMADVLERRVGALAKKVDGLEASLAAEAEQGLPRITRLETEYLRAVTAAELEWVRAVVEDLRSGRLSWSMEQLNAFAAGPTQE